MATEEEIVHTPFVIGGKYRRKMPPGVSFVDEGVLFAGMSSSSKRTGFIYSMQAGREKVEYGSTLDAYEFVGALDLSSALDMIASQNEQFKAMEARISALEKAVRELGGS